MQIAAPTTPTSPSPPSLVHGTGKVAYRNTEGTIGFIQVDGNLAELSWVRFVPGSAPAGLVAGDQVRFGVDLLVRDDKGYHVAVDVQPA